MTTISPEQFGQLKSDVSYLKKTTDKLDLKTDEIKSDIRGLSIVTKAEWEKRNQYVDGKFADLDLRVQNIEDAKRIENASLLHKIAKGLESKIVMFLITAIFGMFLYGVYMNIKLMTKVPEIQINEGQK